MNNNKHNSMFGKIGQALFALSLAGMMTFVSAVEKVTYYHNDALGSPVAATDESGNNIWREAYQPYGSRIRQENESKGNDIWYTGKPEDKATGLSYFGARWYDPQLGRFMAMDPVGFREGSIHSFNRYAYVNNNPYRYVDPDGREDFSPAIVHHADGNFDGPFGTSGNMERANQQIATFIEYSGYATGGAGLVRGFGKFALKKILTKKVTKGAGRKLPFSDKGRLTEVNKTLDRIDNGGPFPYKKDGTVFKNREGALPKGNYREYTVDTPGASNRGARRVVRDVDSGRSYYTDDHYKNFIQIDPKKY